MTKLTPAARLKVKGDTFFLPVPNDGVYFRNNVGTFRMEGETIDRWIEKLVPMFNGEHTLAELTHGLPVPHRNRVFEIAEVLHQKGFVRDVSQDRAHRLSVGITKKYAAQIAFLDSFGDSGAYRFQCYRQADVLAIGSGPFLISLVSALIDSGMPKLRVLITDSGPTNRHRLAELAEHARRTDPEVTFEELERKKEGIGGWREAVRPFQSILYVSQEGNVGELRMLQEACKVEKKVFLPALFLHQTGMAGPVVHPESKGCWESAWRRVHHSAVYKHPELHVFSSTAGALLANVAVFELFKSVAGQSEQRNSVFLLNLETLEGRWHPFFPHPLAAGKLSARQTVQISKPKFDGNPDKKASNGLLPFFNGLTSEQTGIFHIWEEGDLRQLPLSLCRVQAVDPVSEGPAGLLPDIVCAGLTHEEARREAGLAGIEAYVSRLAGELVHLKETVGIGAGETAAEGVLRGLQANLAKRLSAKWNVGKHAVVRAQFSKVDDDRCRFYLQALTAMKGAPSIGLGEEICGFPVVWLGAGDRFYGSVGWNITAALQTVLKAALLRAQHNSECLLASVLEVATVHFEKEPAIPLDIPSCEGTAYSKALQQSRQILKQQGKQLYVADLAAEPFLRDGLGGVFGVLLREEANR